MTTAITDLAISIADDLAVEIQSLEAKNAALQAQLEEALSMIASLESDIEDNKITIASLESDIDDMMLGN